MTSTQLLIICGTVYIAPHVPWKAGLPVGAIMVVLAIFSELLK